MKLEANWKYKSLESLEKDTWGEPNYESYLVTTCHKLRRKPLNEFDIEDLRIMIGQDIGLFYLVPLAIEELEKNIFAEGHFYEGDLLKAVITSSEEFWRNNKPFWVAVCTLFNKNKHLLEEEAKEFSVFRDILKSYKSFSLLH